VNQNPKNIYLFIFKFVILNIALLSIIMLSYLSVISIDKNYLNIIFLVTAIVGQAGSIAIIFILTPALILAFIRVPNHTVMVITAVIASTIALVILIDSNVYRLYHYHINGVLLRILASPAFSEIIEFSWIEWIIVAFIAVATIIAEVICCVFAWKTNTNKTPVKLISLLTVAPVLLLGSQVIHAYADAVSIDSILIESIAIPQYYGMSAKRFITKHHLVSPIEMRQHANISGKLSSNHNLNYPMHQLQLQLRNNAPNILIIGIDDLRPDMLQKNIMPTIVDYAKQSIQFKNHYSGGNCTQPGLFALFYGLPATYWDATYTNEIRPTMLQQLQQHSYNLGIFMSASMLQPPFYKNIFRAIDGLKMETAGDTPWQRDEQINNEAINFLNINSKQHKHFFAFMFYDAVHGYNFPPNAKQPFQPEMQTINHFLLNNNYNPTPYLNRYKNAAYFVDGLIAKVLAAVKQDGLSNNTIVIITTDHGEEFNDNHKDYWGHSSDFSDAQIHIPLIIHIPGKPAQTVKYTTTSFDITPTIMQEVFTIKNPTQDYSIGKSLFDSQQQWPFIIVGSYSFNGIVNKDLITTIYSTGITKTTDRHLNKTNGIMPTADLVNATNMMHRYYEN
jgi:membrane-anchored protein YejM (alkaline phosphatase superfamily)